MGHSIHLATRTKRSAIDGPYGILRRSYRAQKRRRKKPQHPPTAEQPYGTSAAPSVGPRSTETATNQRPLLTSASPSPIRVVKKAQKIINRLAALKAYAVPSVRPGDTKVPTGWQRSWIYAVPSNPSASSFAPREPNRSAALKSYASPSRLPGDVGIATG